jgi:hypothetical protein
MAWLFLRSMLSTLDFDVTEGGARFDTVYIYSLFLLDFEPFDARPFSDSFCHENRVMNKIDDYCNR